MWNMRAATRLSISLLGRALRRMFMGIPSEDADVIVIGGASRSRAAVRLKDRDSSPGAGSRVSRRGRMTPTVWRIRSRSGVTLFGNAFGSSANWLKRLSLSAWFVRQISVASGCHGCAATGRTLRRPVLIAEFLRAVCQRSLDDLFLHHRALVHAQHSCDSLDDEDAERISAGLGRRSIDTPVEIFTIHFSKFREIQ